MAAETATAITEPELPEPVADSSQTAVIPVVPKAAKPGKKDSKKDGKKDGKKAKKKGEAPAPASGDAPSLAAHPRAVRSVARTKSWGGLFGFLFAGYVSLPTSTIAEAGLRALIAGVVCYVASWAAAVFVWRRLVVLEIKAREQQLIVAARGPASEPAAGKRTKAPGA
jgi:hypothetical protein